MLRYIVFCLASALASGLEVPRPEWSSIYTMRVDYYNPGADYQQPIQIWYDGVNNKTRRDAFGGTTQMAVELHNEEKNTSLFTWTFPVTTEEHLNMRNCVYGQGSTSVLCLFRNVLPDMLDFVYVGKEKIHGEEAFKWQTIYQYTWVENMEIIVENVVWVSYKQGVSVPLKLETWTRDINHGTYLEHIYMDIFDFDTSDIDPETWNIGAGLQCENIETISSTEESQDITGKMMVLMHPNGKSKEFNYIDNQFVQFKSMYNIKYETDQEHEKRREIFQKNVRYINEHNNAGHSFKLTVNHLADRTEEELAMLFGRRQSSEPSKALPFPYTAEDMVLLSQEIPQHFDWRDYGAVTPVKNQLRCGSCWAFGAVGAVEGALFLHNGRERVVRLSEQALVDCSWGFDNYGCMGGYENSAYDWMMKHGVPTYDAYGGYLAVNGYCHIDNVTTATKVKAYYYVTPNDEKALQVALFKHGPIAVAIDAYSMAFFFYSHGVAYSDECGSDPSSANHVVLVVGYGVLDGEKYWLVKNSWGTNWGNAGYIMMSTKNNNCGVLNTATYVSVE